MGHSESKKRSVFQTVILHFGLIILESKKRIQEVTCRCKKQQPTVYFLSGLCHLYQQIVYMSHKILHSHLEVFFTPNQIEEDKVSIFESERKEHVFSRNWMLPLHYYIHAKNHTRSSHVFTILSM